MFGDQSRFASTTALQDANNFAAVVLRVIHCRISLQIIFEQVVAAPNETIDEGSIKGHGPFNSGYPSVTASRHKEHNSLADLSLMNIDREGCWR
jgi:hypothetical protein